MAKDATKDAPAEDLVAIEDLALAHALPAWVVAGAKAAYGWGEGKRIAESEFLRLVERWLRRPMEGDR